MSSQSRIFSRAVVHVPSSDATTARHDHKAVAAALHRRRHVSEILEFREAWNAYRSEHQDDALDDWNSNIESAYERLCREVNMDD